MSPARPHNPDHNRDATRAGRAGLIDGLLPLYLRREPTTDPIALERCTGEGRRDVVAYADPACTMRRARWSWHSSRPDRRCRRVTLNCWYWRAVWLADVEIAQ